MQNDLWDRAESRATFDREEGAAGGGEFGDSPGAQGNGGHDDNAIGFSIWVAGGGVKGGHHRYGTIVNFNFRGSERPSTKPPILPSFRGCLQSVQPSRRPTGG